MKKEAILAILEKSKNMSSINLSNTGLFNKDLDIIVSFIKEKQITSLDVSSNNLNNEAIKIISQCKSLRHLDISYNSLSDACIPYFKDTNLEELNLSKTSITDIGIKELLNQTNSSLKKLEVKLLKISNETKSLIGQKFNSTVSNVSNTRNIRF